MEKGKVEVALFTFFIEVVITITAVSSAYYTDVTFINLNLLFKIKKIIHYNKYMQYI